MRMLRKLVIDPSKVSDNNAPDDGIADYDSATTYTAGQYAVVPAEQAVYEALMEVTGVSPTAGALNTPREWRYWRPINEWAMFDEQLGTYTESSATWGTHSGTGIQFTLTPGQRVDTLALLQVDAASVRVEMIDPTEGSVYDETFLMDGGSTGIDSWLDWFTVPLSMTRTQKLIVTGLPNYPDAALRISIQGDPARCGVVLAGLLYEVGLSQYGSSVGIRDYSVKERDEFGRPIITERGFSSRGSFDVEVPAGRTDSVVQMLSEYRATATLWMGSLHFDSTIIFGFYIDHDVVLASYPISELAIDIEGLTNE